MLDPTKWCHPEISTRQMMWLLAAVCLQNLGNYWIRHIRPDWIESFTKTINKNWDEILKLCTGVNMDSWSTYSQERMHLPMSMTGCGLRQATDRRHAQFIGAMAQIIFLGYSAEKKVMAMKLKGRCQCQNSLNGLEKILLILPFLIPGTSWLDQSRNITACPMDCNTPGAIFIKFFPGSCNQQAEKRLHLVVKSRTEECRIFKERAIHSPLDHFGFMEGLIFQHDFATYLGQPCPLVAPFARMYFESSRK